MVAVQGPLSLFNIVLDNMGCATATITRRFSRWWRMEIQKSPAKNPNLWTYNTIYLFFCYPTHLIYVQRAFWAQLVSTAKDPFN